MSRHRSRLTRLGRTAGAVAPPGDVLEAAHRRATVRARARIRRAAGEELTVEEAAALEDDVQAARDLETHRRALRAQGIDPDRDHTERLARIRRRLLGP